MTKDILEKSLSSKRESKSVEFKASFDVDSNGDWCEIIKDIIAISNSGGGIILIGIRDDGRPSKANVNKILSFDHAEVVTKIHRYTSVHFEDLEIIEAKKGSEKIAAILVGGSEVPMVFTKPGTYDIGNAKQKTAFSKGTVYFRHGAKSEPGTSEDLRKSMERQLNNIRKEWLGGVRKVVTASRKSKVIVVPKDVQESELPNAYPIRIVDDPSAPAYRKIDPDKSHPYRQKELLSELNRSLGGKIKVSTYDLLAARRLYGLEEVPAFCHKSKFGSPQYSSEMLQWLLNEYKKNDQFFLLTKQKYSDLASKVRGSKR